MEQCKNVEMSLIEICKDCKNYMTSDCIPARCNIGFAIKAIKLVEEKGELIILEEGTKLIPKIDMKLYDEDSISKSIASVCRLCKECKEHHSEKCIVSLCRKSLENTRLQEEVFYPGNVLMYLMKVAQQNEPFSNKIKDNYLDKR